VPGTFLVFLLATIAVGTASGLGLSRVLPPVAAAVVGLNLATFALYAYDKVASRLARKPGSTKPPRVPEPLLLGLAVLGGGIGGIFGIFALRHKTTKPRFREGVTIVVLVEIGLAAFSVWAYPIASGLFDK